MALQGSMGGGASKANRLSKMSSVPTTEDLRYALAESKKHGKAVELPFENNRVFFIIKVLQEGNKTPRWTFQRGDGATARIIWTRDSAEVLMIQNKIKTESAYDGNLAENQSSGYQQAYQESATSGYQQAYQQGYDDPVNYEEQGFDQTSDIPAASMGFGSPGSVPPASMGFGGAPGSGASSYPSPPASQSFGGGGIPSKGFGVSQDAATSQSGMPAWSPQQPGTSQQGMAAQQQGSIPQQGFSEQAASGRQAPFQPSAPDPAQQASSKILMPPKLAGFNSAEFNAAMGKTEPVTMTPQAPFEEPQPQSAAPYVDPVYQGADKMGDEKKVAFDMSGLFGDAPAEAATTGSAAPARPEKPRVPLPAPVPIDQNLVNSVYAKLADSRTGLYSFDSLLYFLFREYGRYQKSKATGLGMVIMEVVINYNNQISQLPPEGLVPVAQRIRQVGSPVDVAAHIAGGEFAILLDYSDHFALTRFAETLHKAMVATPLFQGWPEDSTVVAMGIATIPHTTDQIGVLVAAAQAAKEMAKEESPPYVIFPN